jgi:hypothetical protein
MVEAKIRTCGHACEYFGCPTDQCGYRPNIPLTVIDGELCRYRLKEAPQTKGRSAREGLSLRFSQFP